MLQLIDKALRWLQSFLYKHGYRPKPGHILYSPSLSIIYSFKDISPKHTFKETNNG